MKNILVYLFVLSISVSCSSNEVIHPKAKFISDLNNLDNLVSIKSEPIHSYSYYSKQQIVGKIGGNINIDSPYFIPDIGGVTVDKNKNIYVAIPLLNEIRIYNEKGEFERKVGRLGRGPGEFTELSALSYNEEHNILIALDNKEVELFSVSPDTTIPLRTIHTTLDFSTNVCTMGNFFYLNGFSVIPPPDSISFPTWKNLNASKPIHKFGITDGKLAMSFGYEYVSENNYAIFNGMLSQTIINCDNSSNIIVGILKDFPIIHGYNADNGKILWKAGIKDVKSRRYIEYLGGDPKLGTVDKEKKKDIYASLVKADSSNFLVQIISGAPQNLMMSDNIDFKDLKLISKPILVNAKNGKVHLLSNKKDLLMYYSDYLKIIAPLSISMDMGSNYINVCYN